MPKAMMTRDQQASAAERHTTKRQVSGEPVRQAPHQAELGPDEALLSVARALAGWSDRPQDHESARAALLGTEVALRRMGEELLQLSRLYQRAGVDMSLGSPPEPAPRAAGSSGVWPSSPTRMPPLTGPMFVVEGACRTGYAAQPVSVPPPLPRSARARPPPLPSQVKSEPVPLSAALLEDTFRMAVPTVLRRPLRPWPMVPASIALLGLLAWALIGMSSPSHRPQQRATPPREQTVLAALPAALPTPQATSIASQPKGVSLASVHVVWGKTSRPAFMQAMRRSLTKMERCFAQKPHEAHALAQTTDLTLRLRRDGVVRSVQAGAFVPADGCIVRAIRATRFPSGETGLLAKAELRSR